MDFYHILRRLSIVIIIGIIPCQSCKRTSPVLQDNGIYHETTLDSIINNDFCGYLYSKDTLNDTLHFNFANKDDFGPVKLSDDELKQIYCEIKRGNTYAFGIMLDHYFYTYSQYNIPRTEVDKLICVTDYLAQNFYYYRGYLLCGNFIFDYLGFNEDDYYTTTMITYYEKYFELSRSKDIAKRLFEIFCGSYSMFSKDSVKARYYEDFIRNDI